MAITHFGKPWNCTSTQQNHIQFSVLLCVCVCVHVCARVCVCASVCVLEWDGDSTCRHRFFVSLLKLLMISQACDWSHGIERWWPYIPRTFSCLFSKLPTWPLNRGKGRSGPTLMVIKPPDGHDHDVCGVGFSNYGKQCSPMRFCEMFTYQWRQFPSVIVGFMVYGRLLEASGMDLLVVVGGCSSWPNASG